MKDPLEEAGVEVDRKVATRILVRLPRSGLVALAVVRAREPHPPDHRHRDHPPRDAPRVRALPHRQARGDEGHRVLPRLRPAALVVPPRRDRVRREGAPARRLRAHHRHEQPGRRRSRRRAPHVPRREHQEPPRRDPRGRHRQPAARVAAVLRGRGRLGPAVHRAEHDDPAGRGRHRRLRRGAAARRPDRGASTARRSTSWDQLQNAIDAPQGAGHDLHHRARRAADRRRDHAERRRAAWASSVSHPGARTSR